MMLRQPLAKWAPLWRAMSAQGVAALLALGLGLGSWFQGGTAALLGGALRLPSWWLPINLLFPPLLEWGLSLHLDQDWFLAGFVILMVVYGSVFRNGVPLYLSGEGAKEALLGLVPPGEGHAVLDMGAGTGAVLAYLAKHRPGLRLSGVEQAPVPWLIAWLRLRGTGCTVRWGSLWDEDMGRHDLIYAFLSPVPMPRLLGKLRREMKAGSLFVSNTFPLPNVPPDKTLDVGGLHGGTLYLYRYESIMSAGGEGRSTAAEDDDDQNRR